MARSSAFQASVALSSRNQRTNSFSGTTSVRNTAFSHGGPIAAVQPSTAALRMTVGDPGNDLAYDPYIRELKVDPSVWKSIFEKPKFELKKREDIKKILLIGAGVSSLDFYLSVSLVWVH